jgi:hypothetical protein
MLAWKIAIISSSIVTAIWILSALITHLLLWRSVGRWSYWRVKHVLPYPSVETAWRVADGRRRLVRDFLRSATSDQGSRVRSEFIELPSQIEGSGQEPRQLENDPYSASWITARLLLQQLHDEDLLAERVIDALIGLYRSNKLSTEDFPDSIRLEPLPPWFRVFRQDRFPWRVVLVTDRPQSVTKWLSGQWAAEWFGIGVDVVPLARDRRFREGRGSSGTSPPFDTPGGSPATSPSLAPLGRCQNGEDGLEGVVGGVLLGALNLERYGLTCRHVLSSTCGSAFWPRPTRPANNEFVQESPDAALIQMNGGPDCFGRRSTIGRPIAPATSADIELAALLKTPMIKSSDQRGVQGLIQFAKVSGFKLGKYIYRGVHFQLMPRFRRRFGIVWPIRRNFTQGGDSGSWIINSETRAWVGMVVGGYKRPNTTSIAISSQYVLEAMRLSGQFPAALDAEVLA